MGQDKMHFPQAVQASETLRPITGFMEMTAMRAPEGQILRHQKRGESRARKKIRPKKIKMNIWVANLGVAI